MEFQTREMMTTIYIRRTGSPKSIYMLRVETPTPMVFMRLETQLKIYGEVDFGDPIQVH